MSGGGAGATNALALAFGGAEPAFSAATEEWTIGQNVKVITD